MQDQEKIHVLIVEDNEDISGIYKLKLASEGYEVSTAFDGLAAFECIEKQMPHIIFLDIVMPRMDGLEFLKKARKKEELNNIPILIMTNLGQDEDRAQCEKMGATRFFVKTEVKIEELSKIITEALEKKELNKTLCSYDPCCY